MSATARRLGLAALLCCTLCAGVQAQESQSCNASCVSDKASCRRAAIQVTNVYRNPPFPINSDHSYQRHPPPDMTTVRNESQARQDSLRDLQFDENRACENAYWQCLKACSRDSQIFQKR